MKSNYILFIVISLTMFEINLIILPSKFTSRILRLICVVYSVIYYSYNLNLIY